MDDNIEEMELCQWEFVDEHGPEGVEEDLACAEEGFAGDGVEENGLERGREISVKAIDAQGFVVCKVVWLTGVSKQNEYYGAESDVRGRRRCTECLWGGLRRWRVICWLEETERLDCGRFHGWRGRGFDSLWRR